MTFYELLLFVHILAAAIWFGAGFLFHVLAHRADRTQDTVAMRRLLEDAAVLSNQLFVPASLVVVLAGVLLVIDGPWSFGELWIVLGLLGYAATFATGVLVIAVMALKPTGDDVALLLVLAAAFAAGAALIFSRAQAVPAPVASGSASA